MGFTIRIKKRKKCPKPFNAKHSSTSTSSTGGSSTLTSGGSTYGSWSAVVPLAKKKIVIKCDKCGKKAAEYYEYVPDYYGTSGTSMTSMSSMSTLPGQKSLGEGNYCKTCHQIAKLIE